MSIAIGCQWDPPHDNPFDPDAPPVPLSKISIQIVDKAWHPVQDATVILRELKLDRILTTDSIGWAHFDELPASEVWWAVAFKDNGEVLKYAADSIEVSSTLAETTTARFRLDALPYFTFVSVNSQRHQLSLVESELKLRLKAEVTDPDGFVDLRSITWRFKEMTGNLQYNPHTDSSFYEAEIQSAAFPGGIGDALTEPFYFEVTDFAENSTQTEASLVRIISDYPRISGGGSTQWTDPLLIRWSFSIWDFEEGDIFYYLLQIEKQNVNGPKTVVYRRVITSMDQSIMHYIYEPIPEGDYDYYVWVIDEFGNYSRSRPWKIVSSNPS